MIDTAGPITISVSRGLLSDNMTLSADFTDRMHELLERNTDGQLDLQTKAELTRLVRIAEFGQIVSMAMSKAAS